MEIAASSLMVEFAMYAVFYGIGISVAYFIGMQCS